MESAQGAGPRETSAYPEHEKLAKIRDRSQTIGEFLDWLGNETPFIIGVYSTGFYDDVIVPAGMTIESVLALYFDIDTDRLEEEKRAMLEHARLEREGLT